jgi:hypothetical protein
MNEVESYLATQPVTLKLAFEDEISDHALLDGINVVGTKLRTVRLCSGHLVEEVHAG